MTPIVALRDAWIVSAVRTPIGRYGGALRASGRTTSPRSWSLPRSSERASTPRLVDDVILGNANGAGEENRNVARMAALLAGFPVRSPGRP